MLRLALPQGGKILAGRVIHRSAVNAMALLDIIPVWLLPEQDAGMGLPGRISPQKVEKALQEQPGYQSGVSDEPRLLWGMFGYRRDLPGVAHAPRHTGIGG